MCVDGVCVWLRGMKMDEKSGYISFYNMKKDAPFWPGLCVL